MFELPSSWLEVAQLLTAIQRFYDCQPMIYVQGAEMLDFQTLCAQMPTYLETFLRTGLASAWPVPVDIYGAQADWILLTCGLLPHRTSDFVIRWNVRAMAQAPYWAVNRPAMAAFFPGMVMVKNGQGQLDTFVWQQIWQTAVGTFWPGNAWQQLVELRNFCELPFANTTWVFRKEPLLSMLTPKQKREWLQLPADSEAASVATEAPLKIDGELAMAVKTIMCHTGHGLAASYFCMVCAKMYCLECGRAAEHAEHTFKLITFQ
jgi:hypothetical protein